MATAMQRLDSPQMPAAPEAEQALIGAALVNNGVYDIAAPLVRADEFADPLNGEIWRAVGFRIEQGREASPQTLASLMAGNEDLRRLGGASYLARLAAGAISVVNAEDYARIVRDQYFRRCLILASQDAIEAACRTDYDGSADALLSTHMATLFDLAEQRESVAVTARTAGASAVAAVHEARETKGEMLYVRTGLEDFDKAFGGLAKGEVTVLAGRPGMGKTGAAATIAINAARAGVPVKFDTLEMSPEQIMLRMGCAQSGIDSHRARKGWLTDDELARFRQGVADIEHLPVVFDDAAHDAASICAAARVAHRRNQCRLLIIDYLGLIDPSDRYRGNRNNEIGEVTRALKLLARSLDIPVLLLSQLSRAVETRDDKHPIMADLRDSGNIEQDAGLIVFLYRAEYYAERSRPASQTFEEAAAWDADNLEPVRNIAEWIVPKDRHGDAPKTIRTHFNKKSAWFSTLAQQTMDTGF